ncbi:hypothetical protein DRJ04_07705, partial [Candidatus Aerophobetes bacterium]
IKRRSYIKKDLWARFFYASAIFSKANDVIDPVVTVWYGRVLDFIKEVENADAQRAEEVVMEGVDSFKLYREEFEEKYG